MRYVVPKDTRALVYVPGNDCWEEYTTEERLMFVAGDVGKDTVTFRYMGTCLQVRKENVDEID